jgi:hypothetical protein
MSSATTGAVSSVDRFFEFSLLGLLASGYLAVVGSGYLDTPTIAVMAAALLIRGLCAAGALCFQVSPRVVAAVTLGYIGFYPLDYAFLSKSFLPATVHLVFFIAVVKILTASTNRDFLFVKVIAFLELLAACVLSSSFNFFLFLAMFLLLAVATFTSSEIRRATQRGASVRANGQGITLRLATASFFVAFGILVLTGLLFFLLPRTARAAFQHLLQNRYHVAGFSNEVSLGEIGELKQQDTPVMHVKLEPGYERATTLKWRGSALAQFDGHRWFNAPARGEILRPDAGGQLRLIPWRRSRGLSYVVHLNEAAPDGALFFAGTPQFLRVDAPLLLRTPVDSYRLLAGGSAGFNYQVFSYLDPSSTDPEGGALDPPPIRLTPELREQYLRLPAVDARIWVLAHRVTDVGTNPESKARLLENYLRRTYTYTLELPKAEAADPLANFLFRRKKGHCEYFASAMAVMLRTIGVPSRVVTGFAGGVYNPISGWQIVRAADAHSWVEAWLPRLGWTTFDPTPPDPNPPRLSIFSKFGFYIDAVEVFWQDWVINYNLDRQLLLAARMEQSSRDFRTNWFDDAGASLNQLRTRIVHLAKRYGAISLSLAVFTFLIWRFGRDLRRLWNVRRRFRKVHRGEANRSDATLLYERMLKNLRRRGIEKPAWLTPFEFAHVVQEPTLSLLVEDITTAYNELRFGGRPEAAGRMVELLAQLESVS